MDAVSGSSSAKSVSAKPEQKPNRLEEAKKQPQEKKPEPQADATVVRVSSSASTNAKEVRKDDAQSPQKVEASADEVKKEEDTSSKVSQAQVDVEA